MDFLEKWTFKIFGKKIPVLNVKSVDQDGKVTSLFLADWGEKQNSLLETWENNGAQKMNGIIAIQLNNNGVTKPAYAAYNGQTVDLFIKKNMVDVPNREKTVGSLLTIDILSELLDMGKSMKNVLVGFFFGMAFYAMFLGPILSAMAK